jgi:hypothetical protein
MKAHRDVEIEEDDHSYDDDEYDGYDEEQSADQTEQSELLRKGPTKYAPVTAFSTTSVFANTPIKSTETYERLMSQERTLFLVWFALFVVVGPLVFRYAMGSNIVDDRERITLRPLTNATISAYTDWQECISCQDVYGVTLYNLTVEVSNVTSPLPDGNTPSLAVFASQDMINWYNLFKCDISFHS